MGKHRPRKRKWIDKTPSSALSGTLIAAGILALVSPKVLAEPVISPRELVIPPVTSHTSTVELPVPTLPRGEEPVVPPANHVWDGIAKCASDGDWSLQTKSSFGGLQIWTPTWKDFDGAKYAPRADLATEEQQIAVAERILEAQGKRAWGACGKYLDTDYAPPAIRQQAAEPEAVKVLSTVGQQAANVAAQYVGWPYMGDGSTWGGTSPADGGFDCSGLVQWSYKQVGFVLPRDTWGQQTAGWAVSVNDLRAGDLIVVNGGGHIGIYDGNGFVINATTPGDLIRRTELSSFLAMGVVTVRRIV